VWSRCRPRRRPAKQDHSGKLDEPALGAAADSILRLWTKMVLIDEGRGRRLEARVRRLREGCAAAAGELLAALRLACAAEQGAAAARERAAAAAAAGCAALLAAQQAAGEAAGEAVRRARECEQLRARLDGAVAREEYDDTLTQLARTAAEAKRLAAAARGAVPREQHDAVCRALEKSRAEAAAAAARRAADGRVPSAAAEYVRVGEGVLTAAERENEALRRWMGGMVPEAELYACEARAGAFAGEVGRLSALLRGRAGGGPGGAGGEPELDWQGGYVVGLHCHGPVRVTAADSPPSESTNHYMSETPQTENEVQNCSSYMPRGGTRSLCWSQGEGHGARYASPPTPVGWGFSGAAAPWSPVTMGAGAEGGARDGAARRGRETALAMDCGQLQRRPAGMVPREALAGAAGQAAALEAEVGAAVSQFVLV
jgi:hypothetical protein